MVGVVLMTGFAACTVGGPDVSDSKDGDEESVGEAREAAMVNQLCRTNSGAILYTSPTSGIYVPPNALVRILDYRGPDHYLARYDGTTGQLERSKIDQSSCYYQ